MASNPAETPDRRRKDHSSDESDKTKASHETIITVPESPTRRREANRVAFKEPSDHEATYYYAAFPSQPRLLGRTSSATTPWFYNEDWPPKYRYYYSGPEDALNSATAAGPVGPHQIHASWETGTRGKIINALSPIQWTSIDVLRIGRTILEENKRPVIVWSNDNCVIGFVEHAPPIRITTDPSYTRDWALIALDRNRFPAQFTFPNVVDLETDLPGPPVKTAVEKVLGCVPDALPADGMMRLRGIIPLREQRGAHIPHPWTTMYQDDSRPIVFKRGRSTGITVGLALDIQSTTRTYLREGIMEQESYEWAIIHASGIDKNREPAKKIQSFTEAGDSGSVVFDITGRIGGLVVRGTNHAMRHLQGYDITYATPMEHVLKDIETELGTKVRIL
ncbi:hypothetical protein HMPREF1624_05300 [Sporothrix schenckii ATCC 58251]|uniref:Uncharacterized protein n=1 Tax=Sporothrix schenckii (strain ATCC 58251 / de Perez 2211183) TaxID=1391915 RepID=U7PUB3_SPOS1|nr:hypothetical protein HMPREF1624_05300 [Sporothrix schenckii ATCC 58251]